MKIKQKEIAFSNVFLIVALVFSIMLALLRIIKPDVSLVSTTTLMIAMVSLTTVMIIYIGQGIRALKRDLREEIHEFRQNCL